MPLFNIQFREGPDLEAIQQHLLGLFGAQQRPYQMAPEEMFPGEAPIAGLQTEVPGMITPQQAKAITGLATSAAPQVAAAGGGLLQQLMGQVFPQGADPTTMMRNFQHLQQLRQEGRTEEAAQFEKLLMKPQVAIQQGAKMLGADAKNWMNPATGQKPPANITIDEAVTQGFIPTTTEEQKAVQAGKQAAPLVASLTETAFGKKGQPSLFPTAEKSITERAMSGLQAATADITEADPRIVSYNRTKDAFVSNLARLSGQVGTLTDRDVDQVRGLFPRAGFTPENIAKTQFKQITNLLMSKGVPESKLKEMGMPGWAFDPLGNGEVKQAPPAGQRTRNTVYMTPKGPLKWTGTGWVSP